MDKEKKKFLRRLAGVVSLKTFASFNRILSLNGIYLLGNFLGKFTYLLVSRHRRAALESLKIAYPELSLRERKKIAKEFFIFMVQGSLELLYFLKNASALDNNVDIEGREYLDQALSRNKGVIILTAHLGNFPLMGLKLVREGYKINIIARPMRDKRSGDYIHRLRTEAGVKTIFSYPRKECVNQTIRVLRNNEIVMIQMDQNFGTGGVWVKFFGKLAATPVGPIVFALRTQASIVPMYIVREAPGRHSLKVFPQVELDYLEDKNELILVNAIKFTKIIENWIRQNPTQWSWIHRRWKSRPSQSIRNLRFKVQADQVT
jgi:KDO2-lipid IV(A) lauroyltransferase